MVSKLNYYGNKYLVIKKLQPSRHFSNDVIQMATILKRWTYFNILLEYLYFYFAMCIKILGYI